MWRTRNAPHPAQVKQNILRWPANSIQNNSNLAHQFNNPCSIPSKLQSAVHFVHNVHLICNFDSHVHIESYTYQMQQNADWLTACSIALHTQKTFPEHMFRGAGSTKQCIAGGFGEFFSDEQGRPKRFVISIETSNCVPFLNVSLLFISYRDLNLTLFRNSKRKVLLLVIQLYM